MAFSRTNLRQSLDRHSPDPGDDRPWSDYIHRGDVAGSGWTVGDHRPFWNFRSQGRKWRFQKCRHALAISEHLGLVRRGVFPHVSLALVLLGALPPCRPASPPLAEPPRP